MIPSPPSILFRLRQAPAVLLHSGHKATAAHKCLYPHNGFSQPISVDLWKAINQLNR